jgi:hypothetical protein
LVEKATQVNDADVAKNAAAGIRLGVTKLLEPRISRNARTVHRMNQKTKSRFSCASNGARQI